MNITNSTFERHKKLVLEHFNVKEGDTQQAADAGTHYKDAPRDSMGRVDSPENIQYEVEKAKGEIKKVIATLSGNYSGAYTVALQKWKQIQQLTEDISKLEEEFKQEGIREKIASLFGSEFEFATRVIKTVNAYEIMLTAQPKAATTVKWEAAWTELVGTLTPELIQVASAIEKKHSKVNEPKPPSVKVKEPVEVKEGVGSMFAGFVDKVRQWGKSYDKKLNSILSSVGGMK